MSGSLKGSEPTDHSGALDPGLLSTPEEARRADGAAIALQNITRRWNRKKIVTYIEANSPSPATVAALIHLSNLTRKQRTETFEAAFRFAWQRSRENWRRKARDVAPRLGITKTHARRLARKLGLR
jgi:hypothetical protein